MTELLPSMQRGGPAEAIARGGLKLMDAGAMKARHAIKFIVNFFDL
jgi:hypothetical protein